MNLHTKHLLIMTMSLCLVDFSFASERAVSIAKDLQASVVNIGSINTSNNPYDDNAKKSKQSRRQFEKMFGEQGAAEKALQKKEMLGSGFVLSSNGYIVTNQHVIKDVKTILVTFYDNSEALAELVGADEKTDIALLKLVNDKPGLKGVTLGDSDTLSVGESVIAIGNPFGLAYSVTEGVLSAKSRSIGSRYDNFLQTDTQINPGNSGGPLLNHKGAVVGVTTAGIMGTGIGFVIPINLAKNIITKIQKKGVVIRGSLGTRLQRIDFNLSKALKLPGVYGALVTDVVKGSAAEKANLKSGDVIVKYNGKKVEDSDELVVWVGGSAIGSQAKLDYVRNGKAESTTATITPHALDKHKKRVAPSAESKKSKKKMTNKLGASVSKLDKKKANILDVPLSVQGVVLEGVQRGSSLLSSGIRLGDVIMEVNGQSTKSVYDFDQAISKLGSGYHLFKVKRKKTTKYFGFEI